MKKIIMVLLFVLTLWSSSFAADTKITALTEDTAPTTDDLLVTVNDPAGTPANRKTTIANVLKIIGFSECKTITNPSSDDLLLFWILKSAVTATKVRGIAVGGTSVVIDVQECTSAGASCANIQTASLTVDTNGESTTSFSDASLAADAVLKIDVGTVTGVVTQVMVCLEGT